jgi:hypothetical protein
MEPLKIDQVKNGCYAACLSCLTWIPHEELCATVPQTDDNELFDELWPAHVDELERILAKYGWGTVSVGNIVPKGFAIGTGLHPEDDEEHACIVLDGKLWHDPHEERQGVKEFFCYDIIFPIVPDADTITIGRKNAT